MSLVQVGAIVEGHGECEAVPILIRRIAASIDPDLVPRVFRPVRVPVSRLKQADELERALNLVATKMGRQGGIVILTDCDWENACPAIEGPKWLQRAKAVRDDITVSVIFAKQEFESWFLAAAESLRGKRGLPLDLAAPNLPESIRGAKEWLSKKMPPGRCYAETDDQPAFTHCFDLDLARRADSFDKCYREISSMLERLRELN